MTDATKDDADVTEMALAEAIGQGDGGDGDGSDDDGEEADPTLRWPPRFGGWGVLLAAILLLGVLAAGGGALWHAFSRAGLFAADDRSLQDVTAFALLLLGTGLLVAALFFLVVEAKAPPTVTAPPTGRRRFSLVEGQEEPGGDGVFPAPEVAKGLMGAIRGERPSFALLVLGLLLVLAALVSSGLVTVAVGEVAPVTTTTTTTTTTSAPAEDGDGG